MHKDDTKKRLRFFCPCPVCFCTSQLDQGCVIPCPTAEDITKRGVPPMSPPLAMWEKDAQVVELEKGELGLGFSILDYQVRPEILMGRVRIPSLTHIYK